MRPRPLTSAAGRLDSRTTMLPPGKAANTVDDRLFPQYSRLLACQPTGWLAKAASIQTIHGAGLYVQVSERSQEALSPREHQVPASSGAASNEPQYLTHQQIVVVLF